MRDEAAFRKAILCDQSPALARAFNDASPGLFTSSKLGKGRLDVYKAFSIEKLWGDKQSQSLSRCTTASLSPSPPSEGDVSHHLEIVSVHEARDLETYMKAAKGFQVYFIGQRNSYAALSTSLDLFNTLSRGRQVSSQFRDYILYFGERESEVEIAPPSLRFRSGVPSRVGETIPLECLCGIRYVEPNSRTDVEEPSSRWSLRQSAVYHRRAALPAGQTWIFATISETAKMRLNSYFSQQPSSQDGDIFEALLLLIDTVMGNWRPYLVALSTETDYHAAQLLGASPDNRGPIGMADSGQRQTLMLLDDKMGNSTQVLKATRSDLQTLLQKRASISSASSTEDVVALALSEQVNEVDRLLLKVEALRSRLGGIANLVSSFLDLSNGFALQQIGKESRRENEHMRALSQRMHILAERNTQDAASIKVLTILTLVYLPMTVVSNFFSTSFVGTGNNEIFVTGDWWKLLASALPLTAITLYVWWIWMRIKAYNIWPWWWSRRFRRPDQPRPQMTDDPGYAHHEADQRTLTRADTDFYESRFGPG